jgi:hypothetical protein
MNAYGWFFSVWGVITVCLVILLVYKSRLTRQESDWIPMTEDAREDRAIQAQSLIEMKTKKLVWPIRTLSTLSVVLLLVILAYWLYMGFATPPAP